MNNGYRQEVFNVYLAQLLQERGVIAAPEDVLTVNKHRKMPDVMVTFNGLRTAIEGEVSDQPNAREKALQSARRRVEDGIAHIGIAIVYPHELRRAKAAEVRTKLSESVLDIAIVTESGDSGFVQGGVDQLERALRSTFDQLVREDVVARAVETLKGGIEAFANVIARKSGIVERIADDLGIGELPTRDEEGEASE